MEITLTDTERSEHEIFVWACTAKGEIAVSECDTCARARCFHTGERAPGGGALSIVRRAHSQHRIYSGSMPASYHIEASLGYIFVRLEGVVTDEHLIVGQRDMFNDALFEGSYSRLVDAEGVTRLLVTADCVRRLSKAAVQRGVRRVALIANTDFVYAMMRMYEGYAIEAECFVCRDRKAALAWLLGELN